MPAEPSTSGSFLNSRAGAGFVPAKVEYVEPIRTSNASQEVSKGAEPTEESVLSEDASNSPTEPAKGISKLDEAKKAADFVKIERRIAKKQAEAQAIIEKADKLKAAFESSDIKEQLIAMGYDPDEAYTKMTKHALDKLNQKQLSPEEQDRIETKRQLKEYKETVDKVTATLNEERAMAAHQKAMNERVAPIFKEDPKAFQVLVSTYGSEESAIANVYQECYNEYCKSGTVIDPKEAALAMNQYYKDILLEKLNLAKNIDAFKDLFKQDEPTDEQMFDQEVRGRTNHPIVLDADKFSKALSAKLDSNTLQKDSPTSKTLSNSLGSSSHSVSPNKKAEPVDHLARFLKEKGIR